MGLLDIFFQPKAPTITSILPGAAKHEILCGRLPILRTDKIFLNFGENCHYIDKAIYEKKFTNKRYVKRNNGYSIPGLFKGTRIQMGSGRTDVVDNVRYETYKGILFLTSQRLIFVGNQNGFDVSLDDLIATTPYSNCLELQFSKETYKLFVPDGNVLNKALHLIKQ